MTATFNSPTGQTPEGVYILDPVTGLPTLPGGASGGLTDAQLRAVPLPLPIGAATEATLAAAAASRWSLMEAAAVDESVSGTTYMLILPATVGRGLLWGVKRITVASGITSIQYAGPTNNAAQANASAAWAARASLVYGLPQEA